MDYTDAKCLFIFTEEQRLAVLRDTTRFFSKDHDIETAAYDIEFMDYFKCDLKLMILHPKCRRIILID